ncbi:thiazolylpeptide-type bacteriocin [Streptomyces sp. NPDC020096]
MNADTLTAEDFSAFDAEELEVLDMVDALALPEFAASGNNGSCSCCSSSTCCCC